ncbi:sensor histidine kinase [Paenibacillus harenae]|uniref:sensor histidine kinase n=1 Tax=Paenibacillus harenae TaxID=306543 RepID=UPI0027905583|nr:sensor histidine kinase [Paenibacillus harenae]MDQ0061426.1 two-component system sensor histidine kinase YesM [Paenibacillus harenae]
MDRGIGGEADASLSISISMTFTNKFTKQHSIMYNGSQAGGVRKLTISWVKRVKAAVSDVYYGLSFRQRIGIAFLLLIALAIGIVGTASYLIASKELQRNAFASSRESVSKTTQLLDDKLYSVSKSVRSIMLSDSFNLLMQDVQGNHISNYYVHLSEMQYQFSQAMFNEPLIESILVATPIGDFYPLSQRRSPNLSFYESNLYYLAKDNNAGLWLRGHTDLFFTGESRVLSFVTKGTQDYFSNTNVYFIVNISESGLIGMMNKGSSQKEGSYFIVDSTGNEVMRTSWSAQHNMRRDEPFLRNVTVEGQGSFFHSFGETEYLVNYSRSSTVNDWLLFGIQSRDKLLAQMKDVQQATIYLMLLFLLAAWFVSSKLTGLLVRPLYRLQRLMREVEDNRLTVRFESKSRDEVAQVGFQFNRMLDEINRLLRDVRASEAGKREAEMRALTAQMEPHFLYNTLNTIYCKSEMGENEEVNKMIMALSTMFQLGLSGGKDWNTLEDELTHVEQYCAIQGMCYEDLFRYEVHVADPELLAYYVPKIILQPIVENSIQHGFRDRRAGGRIHLDVCQEGGKLLHIVIRDNGSGTDPQLVAESMKTPGGSPSGKGFALYNITNRLSLYYGDEARMELCSPAAGGTRTDLWIPMRRGEIQWHG